MCMQDLLAAGSTATDASGNAILADVGPWLRDEFKKYFKSLGVSQAAPLTVALLSTSALATLQPRRVVQQHVGFLGH